MFLSLDLTLPSLIASYLYTYIMSALFDYAGYAAVRAPVESKKKQDTSSFHTYAALVSLGLTPPSLLARSLHTYNMCAIFDYAAA